MATTQEIVQAQETLLSSRRAIEQEEQQNNKELSDLRKRASTTALLSSDVARERSRLTKDNSAQLRTIQEQNKVLSVERVRQETLDSKERELLAKRDALTAQANKEVKQGTDHVKLIDSQIAKVILGTATPRSLGYKNIGRMRKVRRLASKNAGYAKDNLKGDLRKNSTDLKAVTRARTTGEVFSQALNELKKKDRGRDKPKTQASIERKERFLSRGRFATRVIPKYEGPTSGKTSGVYTSPLTGRPVIVREGGASSLPPSARAKFSRKRAENRFSRSYLIDARVGGGGYHRTKQKTDIVQPLITSPTVIINEDQSFSAPSSAYFAGEAALSRDTRTGYLSHTTTGQDIVAPAPPVPKKYYPFVQDKKVSFFNSDNSDLDNLERQSQRDFTLAKRSFSEGDIIGGTKKYVSAGLTTYAAGSLSSIRAVKEDPGTAVVVGGAYVAAGAYGGPVGVAAVFAAQNTYEFTTGHEPSIVRAARNPIGFAGELAPFVVAGEVLIKTPGAAKNTIKTTKKVSKKLNEQIIKQRTKLTDKEHFFQVETKPNELINLRLGKEPAKELKTISLRPSNKLRVVLRVPEPTPPKTIIPDVVFSKKINEAGKLVITIGKSPKPSLDVVRIVKDEKPSFVVERVIKDEKPSNSFLNIESSKKPFDKGFDVVRIVKDEKPSKPFLNIQRVNKPESFLDVVRVIKDEKPIIDFKFTYPQELVINTNNALLGRLLGNKPARYNSFDRVSEPKPTKNKNTETFNNDVVIESGNGLLLIQKTTTQQKTVRKTVIKEQNSVPVRYIPYADYPKEVNNNFNVLEQKTINEISPLTDTQTPSNTVSQKPLTKNFLFSSNKNKGFSSNIFIPKIKSTSRIRERSSVKSKNDISLLIDTIQTTERVLRDKEKNKLRLGLFSGNRVDTTQRTTPKNPSLPPEEIKPPLIIGFLPSKKRRQTSNYDVLVKRRGKFQKVGSGLGFKEAALKGAAITASTSAASFKLSGGLVSSRKVLGVIGKQFRTSKRNSNVLVEKSKFRIDSPGELGEITRKGQAVSRSKTKKTRRKKYGFF